MIDDYEYGLGTGDWILGTASDELTLQGQGRP